jgi:hypothetical protein
MSNIDEIIQLKIKPMEIQAKLVEAVIQKTVSIQDFIKYFESAPKVTKGICADVMEQVSKQDPHILAPYISILIPYINYDLPKVKWGIPEAIGNMAKNYPEQVTAAIPDLLKNTTNEKINTTVIKWCAAFALIEIAKYNLRARNQLIPAFNQLIQSEENNGVKNMYIKAMKKMEQHK